MKKFTITFAFAGVVGASFSQVDEIERMKAMAMENMKKFMKMSPRERREYVSAKEKSAYMLGRKLYQDYSCSGCHPKGGTVGGKVMGMPIPSLKGVRDRFPKFKPGNDEVITLSDMINNCMVMFVNRKPLPLASREMRSLTYFVSNF